jgi:hypothetical protein
MTTLREAAEQWREWFNRGEFDEGAARISEALDAPGADAPSVDRVRVLYGAHLFAFRRGEPSRRYAQQTPDLGVAFDPDDQSELDWLTQRLAT